MSILNQLQTVNKCFTAASRHGLWWVKPRANQSTLKWIRVTRTWTHFYSPSLTDRQAHIHTHLHSAHCSQQCPRLIQLTNSTIVFSSLPGRIKHQPGELGARVHTLNRGTSSQLLHNSGCTFYLHFQYTGQQFFSCKNDSLFNWQPLVLQVE